MYFYVLVTDFFEKLQSLITRYLVYDNRKDWLIKIHNIAKEFTIVVIESKSNIFYYCHHSIIVAVEKSATTTNEITTTFINSGPGFFRINANNDCWK